MTGPEQRPGPGSYRPHMADQKRLSITIDLDATPPVVSLEGEIDVETARDLRQVLDEFAERPQDVVFDMSKVEFIDSSGLGLLLSVRRLGALTLRGLSDRAYRLFELTGLHEVFNLERIDAVVLDDATPPRDQKEATIELDRVDLADREAQLDPTRARKER